MWNFFILFIPLSTWVRREAVDCVSTTSSGLICPLFPKNGGIFRETPRGRRSYTVNPLSAMTGSPLPNGKFRNPDLVTISLSEIWPVQSWLIKVMAPPGEMPTNPFSVVWFLYELKSSLLRHGMCWSTLALDGWPHWNFAKFQKHKITHEMVIRLTVVCKIPHRWLKCSSLNPCLNLQRVRKNLGLIVLVFPAWGHLHHSSDY